MATGVVSRPGAALGRPVALRRSCSPVPEITLETATPARLGPRHWRRSPRRWHSSRPRRSRARGSRGARLGPVSAGWLRSCRLAVRAAPVRATAHRGGVHPSPARAPRAGAHWAARADATPRRPRSGVRSGRLWSTVLALVRDPFYDPYCWVDCDGNAFLLRSWPGLSDAIMPHGRGWSSFSSRRRGSRPHPACGPPSDESGRGPRRDAVGARPSCMRSRAVDPARGSARPDVPGHASSLSCATAGLVALALVAPRVGRALRRRAVSRVVAALDDAPAPHELERTLAAGSATRAPPRLPASRDRPLRRCRWRRLPPVRSRWPTCRDALVRSGRTPCVDRPRRCCRRRDRACAHSGRSPVDRQRPPAGRSCGSDGRAPDARRRIVSDGDDERRGSSATSTTASSSSSSRSQPASGGSPARPQPRERSADGSSTPRSRDRRLLEEVRDACTRDLPGILTDAGLGPAVASLADVAGLPVSSCALRRTICADDRG